MRTFDLAVNMQGFRSLPPYLEHCRALDHVPYFASSESFTELYDKNILQPGMRISVVGEESAGTLYVIRPDGLLADTTCVMGVDPIDPKDLLNPDAAPSGWRALDLGPKR